MRVTIGGRPTSIDFEPGQPKLFVVTDQDLGRNLDKRASRVQMGMRFRGRVRSGKLLSTIRKHPGVGAATQYVDILAGGRGAPYVMIEEEGSRPHIIRARRRKALPSSRSLITTTWVLSRSERTSSREVTISRRSPTLSVTSRSLSRNTWPRRWIASTVAL